MKNWNFLLITVFALEGCWICPDPTYIEFDNPNKIIEVISEDYYIKSVVIAEYFQIDGSIRLIDSNQVTMEQIGARGATTLKLLNPGENYTLTGVEMSTLAKQQLLHYVIRLERFENAKKDNMTDVAVITFISPMLKDDKETLGSSSPCP